MKLDKQRQRISIYQFMALLPEIQELIKVSHQVASLLLENLFVLQGRSRDHKDNLTTVAWRSLMKICSYPTTQSMKKPSKKQSFLLGQ